MIETILGTTVTATMNGAITTECGYQIAKALRRMLIMAEGELEGERVQEPL